ncbi:hypothetical protein BDW62DRAFT_216861 [Aspergillus aurantiobrunneus]
MDPEVRLLLETPFDKIRYLGVIKLYTIDNHTQEDIRHDFARIDPPFQFKRWLEKHAISKKILKDHAIYVRNWRNCYPHAEEEWRWLILGGIVATAPTSSTPNCPLYQIHLSAFQLHITSLDDPDIFRNFRRLLFFTLVHFELSFDEHRWAPDGRGLYARTPALREGLSRLSHLHNEVVAALKHYRQNNPQTDHAILQGAYLYNNAIVTTGHHRQLLDVLAILLLILRAGLPDIYVSLKRDFVRQARYLLQTNDPRISMFEFLETLPNDQDGKVYLSQLYFAFDAYCRYIFMSRIGVNDFKAYYSYDQASFPRAGEGGFYDFFERKDFSAIKTVLASVDEQLGLISHETFNIWHTTLCYLLRRGKYEDMVSFAESFCLRLHQFTYQWNDTLPRQLNLDSALSYYLLGQAHERRNDPINAIVAFETAILIRNHVVVEGIRDPARSAALERLHVLQQGI